MCKISKAALPCIVDYEKASDSVESKGILNSLEKQGIDKGYIDALVEIQNGASTVAMLHRESNEILIGKGVLQGDIISHESFTATWKVLFHNFD